MSGYISANSGIHHQFWIYYKGGKHNKKRPRSSLKSRNQLCWVLKKKTVSWQTFCIIVIQKWSLGHFLWLSIRWTLLLGPVYMEVRTPVMWGTPLRWGKGITCISMQSYNPAIMGCTFPWLFNGRQVCKQKMATNLMKHQSVLARLVNPPWSAYMEKIRPWQRWLLHLADQAAPLGGPTHQSHQQSK